MLFVLHRNKSLVFNDVSITLLLLAGTFLTGSISTFTSLVSYIQPEEHVVLVNGRKTHPIGPVTSAFLILAQSLGFFANSNIPLAWAEIVFCTKKFSLKGTGVWKLRTGVRFYQTFVLVFRLVLFGIDGRAAVPLASGFAVVGILGVLVIFVLARRWFGRMFKTISATLRDTSVLRRINVLTNVVVAATLVAITTMAIYVYFMSQGATLQCLPGEICKTLFLRDVAASAGEY